MEMLEGLYEVDGWFDLNEQQKSILFLVFQDHAKNYAGARLAKMKRIEKVMDIESEIRVYYETEWFHYLIDTETGRSIWY